MVLQLVSKRIDVSMDVPGDKQSFNFSETSSKIQVNNLFVPINGGANNIIMNETKNSYNGGFRWKHTTTYNSLPSSSPGLYSLYKFINNGSEIETEIFSVNQNGNITFNNDVTINGTLYPNLFSLPSTVNVTGTTQTFQFNSAASKFIVTNATSNSVNEYQVNFGGSIGGLRMGVSGDSPSNQFSYINTTDGSPIYLQSDGVNKMYMNGQGSFVVGTSPVGFPYAKFDVHGGELNVINEESVIRATSFTNSAKIEINNSSVSGRLYELRSNSDGSFGIFDRTSNALRLGIDSLGNITGNFPPSSSLTTPQSLPYPILTFNWSYASVTNPSPYEFVNNFTDSQISKNFKYRIATTDIATREWNHDYTLIGNSDLNGIYNLNYKVLSSNFTPLSIAIYPFATSQNLMNIGVPIDMGGFEIRNALNPTTPQSLTTKNYVDTRAITLTGAVTGINSIANPIFTTLASTIPVNGANQIFNYSLNSNVVYRLNNTLSATAGTPSTIALSLNNATNGGYRFLHTSTSADPVGLGTLKLQILNSSGTALDVFTNSISGGGIPDTLFNGTATFNNAVTIQNNQSLIVTGNNAIADYLVMNNTNVSSKTQLLINVTGLPVATFGYDAAASQVYVDSPFGAGSTFVVKFAGTTKFSIDNATGNINLFNSRITNASNPVNPQDYATKSYVDATAGGGSVTLTGAVTGSGTGTVATSFNSSISVSGTTQTFNYSNSLTSSIFQLVNTNPLSITNFRAGTSVDYVDLGYDSNNGYSYINIAQFSNDRLAFRVNGSGIAAFLASGLFGFGTITPSTAKVEINGGVQNITGEHSSLRVISALNSVKIELSNTSASGRLYELRSNSDGSFGILDRNAANNRIFISSAGNIGIAGNTSPNGNLQFPSNTNSRKIVLWEGGNNDNEVFGFGINTSILRYQVNNTASNHVFYAGTSSTTSNELFRITGAGDSIVTGTMYGRRVSGTMSMQNNAVGTTVTTAGTYYKVAGTTAVSNLNGLISSTSNRLTVSTTISHIAYINACFTASHNGAGGEETTFALYKNGAQLTNTLISTQQLNNLQVLSIYTTVSMTLNDYIELWCTSPNNGRVIIVKNLMFNYTTT